MAIPDFQTLMLPLLTALGDEKEHSLREEVDHLANEFKLTPEERNRLLSSGRQPVLHNRVSWARTYMSKAGLIESAGRGRMHITEQGKELLARQPAKIGIDLLMQCPGFVAFRTRDQSIPCHQTAASPAAGANEENGQSPEEALEANYQRLRATLAEALLERIGNTPPEFFERLVVDLLVAMGYGGSQSDVIQAVGGSGDDGIDGIIKEDRLGLDFVYVQAKRWTNVVGRPDVQGFAGSLEGQRARKGVFMTTSTFTKEAHDYVKRIEKRIVLIDGNELANLMIDFGVGVADVTTYQVKRIDLDYFTEE